MSSVHSLGGAAALELSPTTALRRSCFRYPDTFTIYDIRVCDMLRAFHQLGDMKWSHKAWQEYQRFVVAVQAAAPQGLSLRDCDRWLWGQNKRQALLNELAEPG
jgi:hypothetical protein